MRSEPVVTPDAHADVLQAAEHYNAQRPNLGFDFLDEFQNTTSLIREAPLLATLVDPPIRWQILRRMASPFLEAATVLRILPPFTWTMAPVRTAPLLSEHPCATVCSASSTSSAVREIALSAPDQRLGLSGTSMKLEDTHDSASTMALGV